MWPALIAEQAASQRTSEGRGRRPQPEAGLVAEIKLLIAGQAYGYRRIHALLPRAKAAHTLDCCHREAISSVATTGSRNSSDIRD